MDGRRLPGSKTPPGSDPRLLRLGPYPPPALGACLLPESNWAPSPEQPPRPPFWPKRCLCSHSSGGKGAPPLPGPAPWGVGGRPCRDMSPPSCPAPSWVGGEMAAAGVRAGGLPSPALLAPTLHRTGPVTVAQPLLGATERDVGRGPGRLVPGRAGRTDSQASPNPVSASVLPGPHHPTLRAMHTCLPPQPSPVFTALREGPQGETGAQKVLCPRACVHHACGQAVPEVRAGPSSRGPHLPPRGTSGQTGGGVILGAPAGSSVLMTVLPKRLGHSSRGAGPALRAAARRPAGGPRASGRGRPASGVRPSSRGSVLWGESRGSAPQALSGRQGRGLGQQCGDGVTVASLLDTSHLRRRGASCSWSPRLLMTPQSPSDGSQP